MNPLSPRERAQVREFMSGRTSVSARWKSAEGLNGEAHLYVSRVVTLGNEDIPKLAQGFSPGTLPSFLYPCPPCFPPRPP